MTQVASASPRKPRVLFVSFKVRYINPTRQQLYDVLAAACDLVAFGPGYVSLEEVREGPEKFAERWGPFDMIIGDEYTLLRDAVPDEKKHLHRFYYQACDFDPLLIHEGTRYFAFFRSFRGPRVITLLASDYQGFTPDFIDQMDDAGDYFFSWGQELMMSKRMANEASVVGQPQNAAIFRHWNDNYHEFTKRRVERIVSFPHFVGEHELFGGRLHRRRYDWSVMGADYESRVEARQKLDEASISRVGKFHPYLLAAFQKIGFHPYDKKWAIAGLNYIFARALRSARFGFTCGGACQWPIRKYFEIPASGAVLAAERCAGFEALGFVDRSNALLVEPKDILDAHAWLTSDLERSQHLADAGRELVERQHSVPARVKQVAEAIRRIMDRTFHGSVWRSGEMVFREPALVRAK